MPTYEYTCKNCGTNLEVFQSFTDKPLQKCPECSGQLQKVFHARGVVFKGSGFYATDSRGKSSVPDSGNGSSSEKPEPKSPKKEEKATATKSSD